MNSILQCLWTSHFPRETNFGFSRRKESKAVCNNKNKNKETEMAAMKIFAKYFPDPLST